MIDIDIKLMPWQIEFLNDPHKIKVLVAGRQSGKSTALIAGLQKTCTESKGRSAVVMPIQAQSNEFFKVVGGTPGIPETLFSEPKLWPYPQMTFQPYSHFLEYRSFEHPKRLRGGKWTGIVACDEANDLNGDEIMRVIYPKVSTTDAQVLVTSTITHANWMWDLYQRGQGDDPMVKSWLVTSDRGYSFQGKAGRQRLEDLRSVTPKWIWDSEFMCVPNTDNSTCFPYWKDCVVNATPPRGPQAGRRYVCSIDLGRTRDHTVCVVMDDEGLIVLAVVFELGLKHSEMAPVIAAHARHWRAGVVIDATGKGGNTASDGDSHVETYREHMPDLREFFWSGNRNNQTKVDVISHLMLMIEQGRITCPAMFDALDRQMRAYAVKAARGQQSTFGPKNPKDHDDLVSALAQAVWGFKEGNEDWFGDEEGDSRSDVGQLGSFM